MELYDRVSSKLARDLTLSYSTSFGTATKLFPSNVRMHIFNIYGMVRVADEIVDTYTGNQAGSLLKDFKMQVFDSLEKKYSTNPIIHAFQITANAFGINRELIEPFFESMEMDLRQRTYSKQSYEKYIYGSAEVVGLMCLRVFTHGDDSEYSSLQKSARALGSAFQKVNFLRDISADSHELGRSYFPGVSIDTLDETSRHNIVLDIRADFREAYDGVYGLPKTCRLPVMIAYEYYRTLLDKTGSVPIRVLTSKRVRVANFMKIIILVRVLLTRRIGRP